MQGQTASHPPQFSASRAGAGTGAAPPTRRVMILSSFVAHGHVGLSAGQPVLQALGHEVTALPTVILSNHPGWPQAAGSPVPPDRLAAMVDALAANGWLAGHDALLSGYLPTPAHVAFAADLATRMRAARPGLRIVVDPILGDAPKGLYLDAAAARAIRDRLLPLADILTPNAFELGWLTGAPTDTLETATAAAARLAPRVILTSPPMGPHQTGLLDGPDLYVTAKRGDVPHGVGDALAAMIAAGLAPGTALGHLDALIAASLGADHLQIVPARARWTAAPAIPATPWPPQKG